MNDVDEDDDDGYVDDDTLRFVNIEYAIRNGVGAVPVFRHGHSIFYVSLRAFLSQTCVLRARR